MSAAQKWMGARSVKRLETVREATGGAYEITGAGAAGTWIGAAATGAGAGGAIRACAAVMDGAGKDGARPSVAYVSLCWWSRRAWKVCWARSWPSRNCRWR